MNGSPQIDPYTNTILASGMSNPFVGENVDPFTNAAVDTRNTNAYTGDMDVNAFTGLQNASFGLTPRDISLKDPTDGLFDGIASGPDSYRFDGTFFDPPGVGPYDVTVTAQVGTITAREFTADGEDFTYTAPRDSHADSYELPTVTPYDQSSSLTASQESRRRTSDDPSVIRLNVTPEEERNLRANREALAPIERSRA